MAKSKIRVLQIIDKLSMDGTNPSSCTKLFLDMLPRFKADQFEMKVCTLRNPDPAGVVLEDVGLEVFYLNKGKISPANIGAIEALIQTHRIDIVHLHGYSAANFGRIAARRQGIKNVVHEHAILKLQPHQYLADWLLRQKTDAAIAVSPAVREFMIHGRHVPAEKIQVIGNGIDTAQFEEPSSDKIARMKQKYGIPSEKKIIGTLTRFRAEKGNRYLIEAMPEIHEAHPEVVCVLFGEGPLRAELEKLATDLHVQQQVLFPGFVSDIYNAYYMFDVIVIPSVSEGFGLALVEAMAAGRPVVASQVGGMKDIIEDGKTGLFVPPADAGAIAQAVNRYFDDDTMAAHISASAREQSHQYDIHHIVRMFEQLYTDLSDIN